MTDSKRVRIKSMSRGQIGITVPFLNLRRTWSRKGAIQQIPLDILEQAYFEPGVEYLFKTGMLHIEDLEARKLLGLEAEDATEETAQMIPLTDERAEQLLFKTPLKDFRAEVEKMTEEQIKEFADMAIEKELTDFHRCELLKKKSGRDVLGVVLKEKALAEAETVKEEE